MGERGDAITSMRINRREFVKLSAGTSVMVRKATGLPAAQKKEDVREVGSRLELLVDDWLIERFDGAGLRLHSPAPRDVALSFNDVPWEGSTSGYVTVLQDGGKCRLYYRGKPGNSPDGSDDEVTCYAESPDGIHWQRPKLGLFEVKGTRENNVILTSAQAPAPHNFAPFIDTRPGVRPEERFKGLGGLFDMGPGKVTSGGLLGFVSPDGIRWRKIRDAAVIDHTSHPLYTDTTQSPTFWSDSEQRYICYVRTWKGQPPPRKGWPGKIRWIGRTTSPDFMHWSKVVPLDMGDVPDEHHYTNQILPYFRAPHIYIGMPFRFRPERKVVPEHPYPGVSDALFMTSRDGLHWDRRFMEAFVRPGRDRENWTERNLALACGIVRTAPDEMSVYWQEHLRHPTARLRRGVLRLDGFVSVNAGYRGGSVLTRPLVFDGRELVLNYATSAAGSVRVELLDGSARAIPGHSLDESREMYGDEIEAVVSWRGGSSVSAWSGRPVRLRIALADADIFSLRFRA